MRQSVTRYFRSLPVLLLVFALTAGCDFLPLPVDGTPAPTQAPPTPTQPPRPRGGTLTIRLSADVTTLNPWLSGNDPNTQSVTGMIFSGLTRLDNHLQPQPGLADRWDVSEDGTALTFHLREDVRWHDGTPFTAQDVVWSYRTLAQLPAGTPAILHIQETVNSVEAVEPVTHTVRFNLKRRYSPILADLSTPILPSHILSSTTPAALESSSYNRSPIGTGPFVFEERDAGRSITLRSYSGYYAGQPPIDRVGFVIAPSDEVAENAVSGGSLLLAQLPPARAEELVVSRTGTRGGAFNEPGYDFVAFNLREPHPFSDTRLRQAWAQAIDKPGLVFEATEGTGDPVWSDVPGASWAYNPNVPRLSGNPREARRLLTEAGWTDTNGDGIVEKDGRSLEVSLYVRSDNAARRRAAASMAEQVGRAGIRVRVEAADFDTSILARLSPGTNPPFDFDVIMLGWTRAGLDPDPFALFHSSQIPTQAAPGLLNFTGFSAPEYDALVIEGRSTYDYARRKQIYARTQEIIAGELPYYFLWAEKFGVVAGPQLKGDIDFSSPRFLWNVEQWWIEP